MPSAAHVTVWTTVQITSSGLLQSELEFMQIGGHDGGQSKGSTDDCGIKAVPQYQTLITAKYMSSSSVHNYMRVGACYRNAKCMHPCTSTVYPSPNGNCS